MDAMENNVLARRVESLEAKLQKAKGKRERQIDLDALHQRFVASMKSPAIRLTS